jgi:predicted RNA binding protein YcfA (HicA-like mRNA interferase family)
VARWKAVKARQLLAALLRLGWTERRRSGSHRTLVGPSGESLTLAFHEGDEVGPRMLAKIAKRTGLRPEDL